MIFSYKPKKLRSANTYDSSARYEISAHKKEVTGEVEAEVIGGNEENSVRFSRDLVDEGIRASLDPLLAQISALAEMMDPLIHGNSDQRIGNGKYPRTTVSI